MTAQLDHIAQRPANGRLGQATAVEQSRAVAEVQAQVIVAQQFPRDVTGAVRAMREACAQQQLAERAFFAFPRGGQTVSGPSVYLARELARCWGNIQYGAWELRRDDAGAQSEMLAFAWDVQTNTRNSAVFIVPHMRDKRGGPEQLTDMRDIYENNANNGARRVREAIFGVLPVWFTEEAKTLCAKTLSEGGGRPLPQRIADAVEAFAGLGVKAGQLEERVGTKTADWTPQDVASLHVLITSIRRGEIRKDEAFPQERLTAADITSKREPENATPAAPAAATERTAAPATEQTAQPGAPAPKRAVERLDGLIRSLDLGTDEDVRALLEWLTGAPWTATRSQVAQAEKWLRDHLRTAQDDVLAASGAAWKQFHDANPQAGDDSA